MERKRETRWSRRRIAYSSIRGEDKTKKRPTGRRKCDLTGIRRQLVVPSYNAAQFLVIDRWNGVNGVIYGFGRRTDAHRRLANRLNAAVLPGARLISRAIMNVPREGFGNVSSTRRCGYFGVSSCNDTVYNIVETRSTVLSISLLFVHFHENVVSWDNYLLNYIFYYLLQNWQYQAILKDNLPDIKVSLKLKPSSENIIDICITLCAGLD